MGESAPSLRARKRTDTRHQITVCAQALAVAHGLDGFTMDELAEAADVSRRTLFNHFPTKTDAVLGTAPEVPDADVEVFRAGGPHGNLVDDLAALARVALTVQSPDRESLERRRTLLASEPRLLAAVHERFERFTREFTDLVHEREGTDVDTPRARLLFTLVLALFDVALVEHLADDSDRTLVAHFDRQLAATRALFA